MAVDVSQLETPVKRVVNLLDLELLLSEIPEIRQQHDRNEISNLATSLDLVCLG